MGINQLPPQAYTRETLMQAFDWIKTQPRQVQDTANTTDALVSIYMQARRRAGTGVVTHPVSSLSFKQDLKNLAEGLRQFEDEAENSGENGQPTQASQPQSYAPPMNNMQTPPPVQQPQMNHQPQYQSAQFHMPPPPVMTMPRQMSPMPNPYAADSAVNHLDAKSLEVVRLVQSRFNLSSENEALRMLISLGFEKVREIFPKS